MRNSSFTQGSNQNKKQSDYLAKILVIGDGGVGKTSLITRFTDLRFNSSYTATIGVDFKSKIMHYDNKSIKLQIWDTAGQQRFRNITQAYYRGSTGIVLTFSLTDLKSFQNVQKWIIQMDQNAPRESCKILVGTKLDCEEDRVVNRKDAEKLALKMGVSYLQTSAKDNKGVNEVFEDLGKLVYQIVLKKKVKIEENIKIKSSVEGKKKRCGC